jgi:hypothetical protein
MLLLLVRLFLFVMVFGGADATAIGIRFGRFCRVEG